MSIVRRTLDLVNDGMSSRVLAIPTGIPKYDEYAFGTRQGTYYLYGAETGVGKTTFVREAHMHKVYEYYKQIADDRKLDLEFTDFSLEITGEINMASAMTRKLFIEYDHVLPVAKLLGWDKSGGPPSEANLQILHSYTDYFEDFERKLKVYDEDISPNKFHDILLETAKRLGTFDREARLISECGIWTPNNPALFWITFLDTINLAEVDSGHDTVKSSIDRISRIAVWFRNKCNMTFIDVQQFNAEISAVDRSRYGISTPLLRDFEDSKRPTKDANVVWGLYDPQRHMKEEQSMFKGYDITILKSWMRTLHLLKNRNGMVGKYIPLKFDGAVGTFEQLPDASNMTPQDYLNVTRH